MRAPAYLSSLMQSAPEPSSTPRTPERDSRSLLRSSVVTSGSTFISRILGLVREMVFAAVFGDGAAADAFFVAFKIPNFLRRLFAEGAFSQAFVPVLSSYRTSSTRDEVKLFLDHVAGSLGLILTFITVIGVLAAPVLAGLFAPGYLDDAPKFALLTEMLRITFPYILLISLTGFAGAILNSYGHFAVPALTPVILNLVLIGSALLLGPYFSEPALALAWGVLMAGGLQLMFQLPFLAHLKLLPRPRLQRGHPGVKQVISLMLPVMFSVSVGQINLMLDTILATSIEGDGSVSWLYYSDRLMELPLGIIGIAIATVILPTLSRIHSRGDTDEFARTLDWGLRCIVVMGLPASVALVSLAHPLIITLYQRGEFGVDSVGPTAMSLQAYSLGLLAFMAIKVLASAYFSRQDTKTPVRYGVIAMVSNMVLNLVLLIPLAHVGLALATSLSAFINAGLLWWGLHRKAGIVPGAGWGILLLRVTAALLSMLLVLQLLSQPDTVWIRWSDLQRAAWLAVVCAAGGVAYLAALWLSGLRLAHFRV
jgi:putative peptidoglycan lipid II flippase